MEMHNRNQSDLLPYEKLAILGIDREKADSLPMKVKEKLMAGEVTPIMQVSINARNGSIITMPMKLQMTTDKNGAPALIAYPVRAELDWERNKILNLTQQEAERLAKGEVIQKAVNVNGEKTQQYLQLDPETKSVIHRRVTDIKLEKRLKDMEKVNDIELGMQQKQQVREGKPVELNVGGEKVSVGIDLKEQQGFIRKDRDQRCQRASYHSLEQLRRRREIRHRRRRYDGRKYDRGCAGDIWDHGCG